MSEPLKSGDRVRLHGSSDVWTVTGSGIGNLTTIERRLLFLLESACVLTERLEVVRPAFSITTEKAAIVIVGKDIDDVRVRCYAPDAYHNAQVCLAALLADAERREREGAAKS